MTGNRGQMPDYLLPPFKRRRLLGLDDSSETASPLLPSPDSSVASYCGQDHDIPEALPSFESITLYKSSICEPGITRETLATHQAHGLESSALPTHGASTGQRHLESAAEICFGMLSNLTIKRISKLLGPSVSSTPATIVTVQDRELRLLSDPDVLVGTFDPSTAKALSTLKAQEGVQLQAYITQQSEAQRRLPKDFAYTLSVVIYGPKHYSESVGEFLLQCDLHLQDPRHSDRNVIYSNPQSLVQDTRMTQEQDLEVFQEVHNLPCSVDLLADLETEDYLADAKAPIALKTELHSHQKQALTFMERRERGWAFTGPGKDIWRATQSSQKTIEYTNIVSGEVTDAQPPHFRGGLLADQMGLGKSLSIIALIARDQEVFSETTEIRLNDHTAKTTLLVVRAALLQTWEHQLRTHVYPGKLTWRLHHEKSRFKDRTQLRSTDVIITTYHTLMSEWKKHQASPQIMYTTNWRRVVLDEAHDIRDHRSMIAKAMCDIEARSRWALTGTPIQNRISDLASLFKFLRVYPYHDTTVFADQVATLSRDAEQGIDKLKDMIRCIMLRRSIVRVNLPGRHDIVSKLLFSPQEMDAYNRVKYRTLEALSGQSAQSLANGTQFSILSWMQKLLMICSLGAKANISEPCNTGKALNVRGAWDTTTAQQAFNRLVTVGEAICSSCATDLVSVVTEAADPTPGMTLHPALFSCLHLVCGPCQERSRDRLTCRHEASCSHSIVSALSSNTNTEDTSSDKESSSSSTSHDAPTKVKALLQDILAHYDQEKSVVFSFWTSTLDVVGTALERKAIPYVRIDGNLSYNKRNAALKTFSENCAVRVALLTISCGAVGLDLTVASRAYLMEPHWNPSVEQQALARIYRMGQTRPVTTVRFVMRDSFEEHVLSVQNDKHLLAELLLSPQDSGSRRNGSERIKHLQKYL